MKTILSAILIISLFSISTQGQIEVVTSGDVGIGTSTPNSNGFDKVLA